MGVSMNIDMNEESATIKQLTRIDFTEINNIEPIEIPKDILEGAEEMSLDFEDFELQLEEIEGFDIEENENF